MVANSGLTTWSVSGPGLHELAEALRGLPGVDQVVAFGNTLHVSGQDAAVLEAALAPFREQNERDWRLIRTSLEEVFIHLMRGHIGRTGGRP
jgi:ABC-2 type transport system ATP-binding protein